MKFKQFGGAFLIALFLVVASRSQGAQLDILRFSSQALKDNPLHDPVERRVAVFVPDQITNGIPLPVVYWLPGYGSSSEQFIQNADSWKIFTQKVADETRPVIFVVVDCRNRWGGSQYLNSSAQGNYADYVCDEVVSQVESHYHITGKSPHRIIAGHSSGGFGALRLGMLHPELFDGVVALSPDSDFQNSHLPLVKRPAVTNAPLELVRSCMAPVMEVPKPKDSDLTYALGLSAAYTPVGPSQPGQFEWLYDTNGGFRENVWQRWVENDPLTIVKQNTNAFLANQSVYLEGAAQDQFGANIGARKIYDVLRTRPARCTFYEPPGKHSDHLRERLQRAIAWLYVLPTPDIH